MGSSLSWPAAAAPLISGVVDRAPDLLGRARHVDVAHAEVGERVDDALTAPPASTPIVPDSPMPLAPSGLYRRRRLVVDQLEARELGGRA